MADAVRRLAAVTLAVCSVAVLACRGDGTNGSLPEPTSGAQLLYDHFARPDGPLVPGTTPTGQEWMTAPAPAVPPVIRDGRLTAEPGVSYARLDLGEAPRRLEGTLSWSGPPQGLPVVAVATSSVGFEPPDDLVHFVVGFEQWALQIREEGGEFETLAVHTFPAMKTDGTLYRISLTVEGATATVLGPDGTEVSHSDERLEVLHGRYVFFETLYEAGEAQPRWEWVSAEAPSAGSR